MGSFKEAVALKV